MRLTKLFLCFLSYINFTLNFRTGDCKKQSDITEGILLNVTEGTQDTSLHYYYTSQNENNDTDHVLQVQYLDDEPDVILYETDGVSFMTDGTYICKVGKPSTFQKSLSTNATCIRFSWTQITHAVINPDCDVFSLEDISVFLGKDQRTRRILYENFVEDM